MSQKQNDWWRKFWWALGFAATFFSFFIVDIQAAEHRLSVRAIMIGAQGVAMGLLISLSGRFGAAAIIGWAFGLAVIWLGLGWLETQYPGEISSGFHSFTFCLWVLGPSLWVFELRLFSGLRQRPASISSFHRVFDRNPKR